MIASGADRYVVAGHPVEHSQSPFIHTAFAEQTGQLLDYGRLPCPPDAFATTVQRFAAGADARGCNITLPFKFEAFGLARHHSRRALLARACNLLRFDADGWFGDNTDGAGLVHDIELNAGIELAGCRVLLLGAGGAAAGVLGPLLAARPAQLVVANRTSQRAVQLVDAYRAAAGSAGAPAPQLASATLDDCGSAFDVVINATASSLQQAAVPVAGSVLKPGALALDLMYGAPAQPFLDWARAHGAVGRDGLGMLVEQAAAAFLVFRGVRPETATVLTALRRRLAVQQP